MYWQRLWRKAYGKIFDSYSYSSHIYVFHEYRAIYLAVPKVANSSLKTAFWHLFPEDIRSQTADEKIKRRAYTEKKNRELLFARKARIMKHQVKKYPDYFKFAFVRNPWDRLVSCYSDKILSTAVLENGQVDHGHNAIHSKAGLPEKMKFDAFVKKIAEIPDHKANRHFRSQHTFLCSRSGHLLPGFIGHYESLQDDFNEIQHKLGTEGLELPVIRKSDRVPYQSYYTDELRDIVYKRYERDIELFGYRFD